MRSNKAVIFSALFIILLLSASLGLILGGKTLSVSQIVNALSAGNTHDIVSTIVLKIRLPRVLLAVVVGAGLAASGCILQGILRNPLAGPYTLGISGGAALGVSLGVLMGLGTVMSPVSAAFGALLSVSLVYFASSRRYFSAHSLILSGVILNFLFSSMILLLFALVRPDELQSIMQWLLGDLSSTDTLLIKISSLITIAGLALLYILARDVDILTLGEEKATHLGVDANRTIKFVFIIASLVAGACVASSGIIGFVGIVIPHFMRRLMGPAHRPLIVASSLAGAIFLILSDPLARTIIYPMELPVGVVTGIVGGVIFLLFILKGKEWAIF